MKNKKIMIVFILVVAVLLMMISTVRANDTIPLNIVDGNTQNNTVNNTNSEEENNDTNTNNQLASNVVNNTTNSSNAVTNTLPQTGVASDTALFVFVGVCVISAIYAYTKIRKYRNIG